VWIDDFITFNSGALEDLFSYFWNVGMEFAIDIPDKLKHTLEV
jgi:hypothetical protein